MVENKSVVRILRSQVNTRRGKSILEILQPGGHWYFSETVLITLHLEIYSKKIIIGAQKTLDKRMSLDIHNQKTSEMI